MRRERIVTGILERLTSVLAAPRRRLRPFRVGRFVVGWLDDVRAERLAAFGGVFETDAAAVALTARLDNPGARTAAMAEVAHALSAQGELTAWRDERYAVMQAFGDEPLFLIERAAARYFGIRTYAAHANGVVAHGSETRMWIARRSASKAIDPGMLDNLVGGGIAAGATVRETLIKEAWEEAGIPKTLAAAALPAGEVRVCREQPDGLQRETVYVHDLWLPAEFTPSNQDGEVVEQRLVGIDDVASLIGQRDGSDVVTGDASLVILDFLLRRTWIPQDAREYAALDALRRPSLEFDCDVGPDSSGHGIR